MLWLRDRGHVVTGVELSSIALETFCAENGVPVTRRTIELFEIYEAAQLRLICGDFFALAPELLGPVAGIYDRASLISWAPHLRSSYVNHLTALTTEGTVTLLIVMEYPQAQMSGPPFSVPSIEVERLFARHHNIYQLSRRDILANEPRLQARGLTALHEVSYRLTRL